MLYDRFNNDEAFGFVVHFNEMQFAYFYDKFIEIILCKAHTHCTISCYLLRISVSTQPDTQKHIAQETNDDQMIIFFCTFKYTLSKDLLQMQKQQLWYTSNSRYYYENVLRRVSSPHTTMFIDRPIQTDSPFDFVTRARKKIFGFVRITASRNYSYTLIGNLHAFVASVCEQTQNAPC